MKLKHGMQCSCGYCKQFLGYANITLPYADGINFITRYNVYHVLSVLNVIGIDTHANAITMAAVREFNENGYHGYSY